MVATETKPQINSAFLFAQLTAKIKGQPDFGSRVLAHIKAVSGADSMAAFLNGTITEQEKVAVLSDCLRAIITRNFDKLKGGQPVEVKAPEPPKPTPVKPKPAVIEVQADTTQTVNAPPPVVQPVTPTPAPVDPKLAAVMAALQNLAQPQQPAAPAIDRSELRQMVEQVVAETMGKVVHAVIQQQIKKFMEHAAKAIPNLTEVWASRA